MLDEDHFLSGNPLHMSFLSGLPSSGNFVNAPIVKGTPTNYICEHTTTPPENQIITSDDINPLVRALRRRQREKQNLKRQRDPQPSVGTTKKRRIAEQ